MLEEAFLEQMKEVVRSCSRTRQTLLFSATMTDQVEQLATVSLNKPVKVFVDSNKVSLLLLELFRCNYYFYVYSHPSFRWLRGTCDRSLYDFDKARRTTGRRCLRRWSAGPSEITPWCSYRPRLSVTGRSRLLLLH